MTFLNPAALWWTLLAIPVALLYLCDLPQQRVNVANGFLWSEVLQGRATGGVWRKWRRPVSLALHLGALVLMAVAMAEPVALVRTSVPLWTFPAAAALALIVAEWCLRQRCWTC